MLQLFIYMGLCLCTVTRWWICSYTGSIYMAVFGTNWALNFVWSETCCLYILTIWITLTITATTSYSFHMLTLFWWQAEFPPHNHSRYFHPSLVETTIDHFQITCKFRNWPQNKHASRKEGNGEIYGCHNQDTLCTSKNNSRNQLRGLNQDLNNLKIATEGTGITCNCFSLQSDYMQGHHDSEGDKIWCSRNCTSLRTRSSVTDSLSFSSSTLQRLRFETLNNLWEKWSVISV